MKLELFKVCDKAELPARGTKQASCYDLQACLHGEIAVYYKGGKGIKSVQDNDDGVQSIVVRPRERIAVPTGFVLNIPEGFEVKLYARSGLSLKNGISLSNSVGVIDCDYKEELYVTVINNSDDVFILRDGMRIAQFEMVAKQPFDIAETTTKPTATTDRKGGLGSTGTDAKKEVEPKAETETEQPKRKTKSMGAVTKEDKE